MRAVHSIASPPEGEIRSKVDVQQGFGEAYELAQERGVRGGVAIFHGFRIKQEFKEMWQDVKDDWKGGIWSWVRENEEFEWREMTYWSPHYHIVGLARDVKADTGSESDVWRFRRIRSLERFSLHDEESYEDSVGLASYILSHLTIDAGSSSDSVRWFGELSTAKFSPQKELSDGSLSVIRRMTAEVVDPEDDEDGVSPELLDDREEPTCDCCGAPVTEFCPIWEAGRALQDREWCAQIGEEQQHRLTVAFEWAIGEVVPPPGMRRPTTEEAAREAFGRLL